MLLLFQTPCFVVSLISVLGCQLAHRTIFGGCEGIFFSFFDLLIVLSCKNCLYFLKEGERWAAVRVEAVKSTWRDDEGNKKKGNKSQTNSTLIIYIKRKESV